MSQIQGTCWDRAWHTTGLLVFVTTTLRDQGELATLAPPTPGKERKLNSSSAGAWTLGQKSERRRASTHFIHRSNKYVAPQICSPDGRDSNLQFVPDAHALGIVQVVDGEPFGSSHKHIVLGNSQTIRDVAELEEQQQTNKSQRKKGMIFQLSQSARNRSQHLREGYRCRGPSSTQCRPQTWGSGTPLALPPTRKSWRCTSGGRAQGT